MMIFLGERPHLVEGENQALNRWAGFVPKLPPQVIPP
jgi:hypothetical protein